MWSLESSGGTNRPQSSLTVIEMRVGATKTIVTIMGVGIQSARAALLAPAASTPIDKIAPMANSPTMFNTIHAATAIQIQMGEVWKIGDSATANRARQEITRDACSRGGLTGALREGIGTRDN